MMTEIELRSGPAERPDRWVQNEGESMHTVSPSTIPLTLGEETAVLCCRLKFTRIRRRPTIPHLQVSSSGLIRR